MSRHIFPKLVDTVRCVLPGRFDRVKFKYDDAYAERMNAFAQSGVYEDELRMMVSGLVLGAESRLLDLGCNTGQSMHRANQWTGCDVWGIDQNRSGIEKATSLFPQFRFDSYDGDQLPYEGGLFDAVMINHVIGHVADPESFLFGVHRVLKPGGRIGLVTPNRNYKLCMMPSNLINTYNPDQTVLRYYTTKSLSVALQQSGFDVTECKTIGEYPKGFSSLGAESLRFRVFSIGKKKELS
jgi:ubiquinone/menaquinone biosynthesis C-methylase UbiE